MRPLLERLTRITTRLQVIAEEPLVVHIDRISLAQILMNLVANADDSIVDRGRVTVHAHAALVQTPGESAELVAVVTVTDDGVGLDRQAIEHAFESGFTTKGSHHSGLGLATVWQLIDRFGGSVGIESSPTVRTTVNVRLPLAGDASANGPDEPTDVVGDPVPNSETGVKSPTATTVDAQGVAS